MTSVKILINISVYSEYKRLPRECYVSFYKTNSFWENHHLCCWSAKGFRGFIFTMSGTGYVLPAAESVKRWKSCWDDSHLGFDTM
jgi:hypothetical protein